MYQFRPITEENLNDIVFLFRTVVRKTVSARYLQRKYSSPWSEGRFWGFMAFDEATGKPVAMAMALPCCMVSEGRRVPAAQTIDTFTAPSHTGRGLMTSLLRLTIEDLEAHGIRLFFGFCNQNSLFVCLQKLGWTQLLRMEYYLLPGAAVPLEAILRRCGLFFLWRFFVEKILDKYTLTSEFLPNALLDEGYSGMLHDAAYFQYKRFTFNRLVNISGTRVWIKAEGGLLVGDVQFGPETDFDALLNGLRKLARRLGLRRVVFQASPQTRLQAELSRRLAPHTSWIVVGKTSDPALDLTTLRFSYADIDTF